MSKLKKAIPLLGISLLIASCGETSDSISSPSSPQENTPKLTQKMISEISGDNLTADIDFVYDEGEIHEETSFSIFLSDGLYGILSNGEFDGYFRLPNGNCGYSEYPDKHNNVQETPTDMGVRWDDALLENKFAELDSLWFTYDAEKSTDAHPVYAYDLEKETEDSNALMVQAGVVFYADFCDTINYGGEVTSAYLYTDGEKITGMDQEVTYSVDYYGTYFEYKIKFSMRFKDIGTTKLTQDDLTKKPYDYKEEEEGYYNALSLGLDDLRSASSYRVDYTALSTNGDTSQDRVGGYFLSNNELNTKVTVNGKTIYSGYHRRSDGAFELYEGDQPDKLVAQSYGHIDSLKNYFVGFDVAKQVFKYDAAKSTSSLYHFDLRDSYAYNMYALNEIAMDFSGITGLEFYAKSLSLDVTPSAQIETITMDVVLPITALKSIPMEYKLHYDTSKTSVDPDLADFSNYSEFVPPSSFEEMQIEMMLEDGEIVKIKASDAIAEGFNGVNVPFIFTGDLSNYYADGMYFPAEDGMGAVLMFTFSGPKNVMTLIVNKLAEFGLMLEQDEYGDYYFEDTNGAAYTLSYNPDTRESYLNIAAPMPM